MASLLKNLLYDLRQRTAHLVAVLGANPSPPYPPPAEAYRQRMLALTQRGLVQIEALANDPDLLDPAFLKDNFRAYKVLARLACAIEWGPVAALRRFSPPDDAVMCLLVEQICSEVRYPFPTPLCVAGSPGHYSTYADLDLILAPCSEPFHLLGLSDVIHELGHIVALRKKDSFIEPAEAAIDAHFAAELRRATQDGSLPAFLRKLDELRKSWKDWVVEFIADMIAAYLAGPAYGWANVRLCMNVVGDVFESTASHPADEARTAGIELVLQGLGCPEASAIRQVWNDFVSLTGKSRPAEFDIDFPADLLVQLRDHVLGECRNLGLQAFQPQPGVAGVAGVVALLNEAWETFNRDPAAFAQWEAEQVARLTSRFGY